jgi:signal transduction histidine kinase
VTAGLEHWGRRRSDDVAIDDVFAGDSEMAKVMRAVDWSRTRLGPVDRWSQSLRMMVRLVLANRFPNLLWWGSDYVQLYNDAYRPILGTKHPASMGQPTRECWHEIWHILAPLIHTPFHGGPATWMEDIVLEINRYGFVEETHFTIAYSPVPDETAPNGIGGVLATVHEITQKVVGERRVAVLRDLGRRSLTEAQTAEAACATAAGILAQHPYDVPFAALYLVDADGTHAHLAGTCGVEPRQPISPEVIDVVETGTVQVIRDLGTLYSDVPRGPWSDPPHSALIVPIPSNTPGHPAGLLVAGVSPRLALDEQHVGFFELLAAQLATGIANARAYEQEKQRSAMLAELDRAKTQFFSNVSHEFRTPLTLMLGPTTDLIAHPDLPRADRDRLLETVHRNALRLQKLVNSMLDFSRIEAGRVAATYEPVDLATFTAELASAFRSATERAGLALTVDAPTLPAPVHVDRDMWEKIVLNLLSNAFKHTFEGSITVRVHDGGDAAIVDVVDTGVGIAGDQLPRIFERFHRVPNARSRTHEGTGIGLALVQELVRWHGARIDVSSAEGIGTTFTITVPYGTAHLPADRLAPSGRREAASTRVGAMSYVEEALRWLPPDRGPPPAAAAAEPEVAEGGAPRILLADDNSDMRDYVARLLRERGWVVEAVGDGRAALTAAQARRPDLVLSDVMMPGLDGFALLHALRSESATAAIPVVLLSARAGEEARIEGAQAGADDYLVKPFGAQELLARVGAQLSLARERARALRVAEAASRAKSDFLAMMSHELRTPLNAIGGYASLMEMGVHGPLTDEQRSDLARIQQSQTHLLGLINQVLGYTLGRTGTARYDLVPLPVHEAIEAAEALVVVQARARGLTYTPAACNPSIYVLADREKLQQILLNLLTNAIKFTETGGEIRTTCTTDATSVAIEVSDTGIGIPADKLGSIFEAFVQVDQRLTRPREGVGLGLAISRDLARGMGGDLNVESTPGVGSTFTLTLTRTA